MKIYPSSIASAVGIQILLSGLLCLASLGPVRGEAFADWQSIHTTGGSATGLLRGAEVRITGPLGGGVLDGQWKWFDSSLFTPRLASSDLVYLLGIRGNGNWYSITFQNPVLNPRFHFQSLASTVSFSNATPNKLSGDPSFTVAGNTVTGAFNDTPGGYDANGTVILTGVFTNVVFRVTALDAAFVPPDGIGFHIGVDTPIPRPDLLPGCVGYWAFDEGGGTNVLDSSGTGNHGWIRGATQWSEESRKGGALQLDGQTGDVQVVNLRKIPFGNAPRTVSLWARWSGTELWPFGPPRYQSVFGYGVPFSQAGFFTIERGGDSLHRKLVWFDWGHSAVGTTPNAFPSNQWVHVAAVHDGVDFSLFLDGIREASLPVQMNTLSNALGLLIGNCPPNDGWHANFAGLLDEVSIFNRALSVPEVLWLKQNGGKSIMTSPPAVEVEVGLPLAYGITATDHPVFFDALGLPAGFSVNRTNGIITGSANGPGVYEVTILLGNAAGTNRAPLQLKIYEPMPVYGLRGCIGYWSFDEPSGTNVLDQSDVGNHGHLVGRPLRTANAWRGRALQFNGEGDAVQIPAPKRLPLGASPRSIACWAYWSGREIRISGTPRYQSLFGYGVGPSANGFFTLERGGDYFHRKLVWFDWGHTVQGATSDALPANRWVHVAATYNGNQFTLYLNGVVEGSGEFVMNTLPGNLGVLIGSCPPNDGWHAHFSGILDEVCFFDRALTQAEVQRLMVLNAGPSLYAIGSGSHLTVTWHGQPGVRYQPKTTIHANSAQWDNHGPEIAGTNGPITLALPLEPTPLFLRVEAMH